MLILDMAAGKESLWRVTEQLIISHSAPHTVEMKRGGGGGARWRKQMKVERK